MAQVNVGPGEVVIREGETGDSFYVVAEGMLDVSSDHGAPAPPMVCGDFFGEIALLRDCPRTATVTARSDSVLYSLEREAFLLAVSAHPRSTEAAHGVADARVANGNHG